METTTKLGQEGPGHTYAYNRRLRRLANAGNETSPNFGKRIDGEKSVAHIARTARRIVARVRAKQQREAVRLSQEKLKNERI